LPDGGLSVRDAEKLAQKDAEPGSSPAGDLKPSRRTVQKRRTRIRWRLKRSLSDVLGLKVQLAHKGQGGQLRIDYKSLEQLDELCRLLGENRLIFQSSRSVSD
jgi:ParB family chromosome partitioning protein